ncbi:capsular exopolysaccharide synthesis family protein [Saonia flava]|uniref:non-specific protein-tyrosine kinase n=1 Tax=Saonia flava TaxID=523696 RepID=A0A846QZL2_9FLAO|nr:polysaccharide biosynthesis tyrosine autokinase [Saonia flava]NJB72637.1 capsular exopolysaccharide synthesis family protein [Saonia flava]
MKESPFIVDFNEDEESFNLKETLLKYLPYWPWFLVSIIVCIGLGYFYTWYKPVAYESVAKIKIIDDTKEVNVASEALSFLNGSSAINLDNEIEVLKSYRLLRQVVTDLDLDISYYRKDGFFTKREWNPPFKVEKKFFGDSIQEPLANTLSYRIKLNPSAFTVVDDYDQAVTLGLNLPDSVITMLPFTIKLKDSVTQANYQNIEYSVVLNPVKEAVLELSEDLKVESTNKTSEILSLSLIRGNMNHSEAILNTLIQKFDQDGILDRQLISKRTLDVIDKRFVFLSGELDSIEIGKQDFKQSNNLSYIEADAGLTLQRKSNTEDEVFNLRTQVSLSDLLKKTVVNQPDYSLLPADIGLENNNLNNLVNTYNEMALQRDKLLFNVGRNHPTLVALTEQLERGKVNILKTINVYQAQLRVFLKQLNQEKAIAGAIFSGLPEKEKALRAIERQQSIKENLFLVLLQKREEAAISLAATTPSIKVVDYGLTNSIPVSPKKRIIYPLSLLLGMLLPFGFLYTRFLFDTKIYNRGEIEKLNPELDVLGEIPFIKGNKNFKGANDRSILAESFRILSTNVNYLLPEKSKEEGQVIFVTSAIKGEGKTLVAYNLSLSYASIKKRVLLIGADLRNPQLNDYFDNNKKVKGLSDFLSNPNMSWQECIHDGGFSKDEFHKVCFSGAIRPNATELLAGKGFGKLISHAKKEYDYIIVDTAPTILVTDTMLISNYADITLFVVRAGLTDKKLMEFSASLNKRKKLKNMAYVLNDIGHGKAKDYNYGREYGYGA